jgi:hypothetical protein
MLCCCDQCCDAERRYAECRNTECRYTGCRGAPKKQLKQEKGSSLKKVPIFLSISGFSIKKQDEFF